MLKSDLSKQFLIPYQYFLEVSQENIFDSQLLVRVLVLVSKISNAIECICIDNFLFLIIVIIIFLI